MQPVVHIGEHDEEPVAGLSALAERHEEMPEVVDGSLVWSGTTSHNFVDVIPNTLSQFACTTYNQVCEEVILSKVRRPLVTILPAFQRRRLKMARPKPNCLICFRKIPEY